MIDEPMKRSIAVRLEGGLGDHILGLRILRHIRRRYPAHDLIAYSDAGGHASPAEAVRLSPLVSAVIPVYQAAAPTSTQQLGSLANLRSEDREKMHTSDLLVDASGAGHFAAASIVLDTPLFEIMADRPNLVSPPAACEQASHLIASARSLLPASGHDQGPVLVAINLSKYGSGIEHCYRSRILPFLQALLAEERVVVLNLFTSTYDYPHWPVRERALRRDVSLQDTTLHLELGRLDRRVLACVDLPIATVAALLGQCRYFIGVDNGIKHLAWALDVPHTFFHPEKPPLPHVLRWMPDLHRLLLFDCDETAFRTHLSAAQATFEHAV